MLVHALQHLLKLGLTGGKSTSGLAMAARRQDVLQKVLGKHTA